MARKNTKGGRVPARPAAAEPDKRLATVIAEAMVREAQAQAIDPTTKPGRPGLHEIIRAIYDLGRRHGRQDEREAMAMKGVAARQSNRITDTQGVRFAVYGPLLVRHPELLEQPSAKRNVERLQKALQAAKSRGVKLKKVTDRTVSDDLKKWKELAAEHEDGNNQLISNDRPRAV